MVAEKGQLTWLCGLEAAHGQPTRLADQVGGDEGTLTYIRIHLFPVTPGTITLITTLVTTLILVLELTDLL